MSDTRQIAENYGLSHLSLDTHQSITGNHYIFKDGAIPMVSPDTMVGIELEIEELDNGFNHLKAVQVKHDGSLRGNAIEAVTWPMPMRHVECLVADLVAANKLSEKNYSDRCSVHVHVNMLDLTISQVKAICLTYQTVERLLFNFIGEERENNIYCVPWYQAGLSVAAMERMTENFDQPVRNWVKYTSLNLLPLRSQGTIEFRHLRGTCDVNEICTWLNLIGSIVEYGKRTSYDAIVKEIMAMNTVSNYEIFLRHVFGEHVAVLTTTDNWRQMLSTGVIDSKLMLMSNKKKAKTEEEKPVTLDDDLARLFNNAPPQWAAINWEEVRLAHAQQAIMPAERPNLAEHIERVRQQANEDQRVVRRRNQERL